MKDKKYCKVRHGCHYTGEYTDNAHSMCNLKYIVARKVPVALHNGSNYDHHFIINELAEEFEKQFTCLGENTEKYITFPASIGTYSLLRSSKNWHKLRRNYKKYIFHIDSARFMASSLSNLVNNPSEEIHKIKCKYRYDDEKCETFKIKYNYWDCFLEYTDFKDDLIEYKSLCCNKTYQ